MPRTLMSLGIGGMVSLNRDNDNSCLSLHTRLHATVAVSASPEAQQPSQGTMRWQMGDGQMPHLIYPQATGTRPSLCNPFVILPPPFQNRPSRGPRPRDPLWIQPPPS